MYDDPVIRASGLVTFLKSVSRKMRLGDLMLGLGMFLGCVKGLDQIGRSNSNRFCYILRLGAKS